MMRFQPSYGVDLYALPTPMKDRAAALRAFSLTPTLPRKPSNPAASTLAGPRGTQTDGLYVYTAGYAPDETNTYSMQVIKVGDQRVVYEGEPEYNQLFWSGDGKGVLGAWKGGLNAQTPTRWSWSAAKPMSDRVAALNYFTRTQKLPSPPLPPGMAELISYAPGSVEKVYPEKVVDGVTLSLGWAPDETMKYSLFAIRVGNQRVVYSGDPDFQKYATLAHTPPVLETKPPTVEALNAVAAARIADRPKSTPGWVSSPWTLAALGLAAALAYHHFTRPAVKE